MPVNHQRASVLGLLVVLVGCDAKEVKSSEPEQPKSSAPARAPGEPSKPSEPATGGVEVSESMAAFAAKFDGEDGVVEALDTFAGSEAIKTNEIRDLALDKAKVVGRKGDCYTMQASTSISVFRYEVCWTADKVSSINLISREDT